MSLTINNKVVLSSFQDILKNLQKQLKNGKLKYIDTSARDNIKVTCPIHKDGKEKTPSCFILINSENKKVPEGSVHCFSCGYHANFFKFIADCFDESDEEFGKKWLLNNSEIGFLSDNINLKPIDLNKKKSFLDESCLDKYKSYHEYMWKRKLTKEIVDLFEVGYDKDSDMITFPVRDELGRLLFITKRSVKEKKFFIPEFAQKPVYLLYYCVKNNINRVAVCESQINALYCWSLGIPAIALFGTGDVYQYGILNKSGIRVFDTFFDGDDAGDKGFIRFKENMKSDVIIIKHVLPLGKDVNDLSLEEIKNLQII